MTDEAIHVPVLLHESIGALGVHANGIYIDATAGQGGHCALILERSAPRGIVYAFEWDAMAIQFLRQRFAEEIKAKRCILIHDSFANMDRCMRDAGCQSVDGILFDFGFSRFTIEQSRRGFSFRSNEPLVMTYDAECHPNAAEVLDTLSESDIADLIWRYGQERFARRIARAIVRARAASPIATTGELAGLVFDAYPGRFRHARLHPATKTFQALRIAVNHELENIEAVLPQAVALLAPQGRLVALTFHSLEDRIVKQFMRGVQQAGKGVNIFKKPVEPSAEEISANSAARSAKMRVLEKTTITIKQQKNII